MKREDHEKERRGWWISKDHAEHIQRAVKEASDLALRQHGIIPWEGRGENLSSLDKVKYSSEIKK